MGLRLVQHLSTGHPQGHINPGPFHLPAGHRAHLSFSRQPVQPVTQGGFGDPAEAGQFLEQWQVAPRAAEAGVLLAVGQPVLGVTAFLQLGYGVAYLPSSFLWRCAVATSSLVAPSSARGLSPTAPVTARGRKRPRCPRSRNRQRVWRETPKGRAAWGLTCHRHRRARSLGWRRSGPGFPPPEGHYFPPSAGDKVTASVSLQPGRMSQGKSCRPV